MAVSGEELKLLCSALDRIARAGHKMARDLMTFLVLVYNEAKRIRHVLGHAEKWAKEIVVMDKGSTDGTLEILREHGDRVRVVPIPYSDRGHEDLTLIPQYVTQGWIFFGTCSEIPTRKLIQKCREVIEALGDQLDLIYVPRLMYFFGLHRSPDNGGVCHYPFLIHRDRTLITREIHNNFHPKDSARTYRIPYADDCCVHHLTHPTVQSFWLSSLSYFEVEIKKDAPPERAIRDCFKNIEKLSQRMLLEGENWLPFYCALASYELGKALHVWEKARGRNQGSLIYKNLREQLLAREWTGAADSQTLPSPPRGLSVPEARPVAATLGRLPYLLIKCAMLLQRLQPWRR